MKRISAIEFDALAARHRLSDEQLAALVAASRPKVERAMSLAMVRGARVIMARSFDGTPGDSEADR